MPALPLSPQVFAILSGLVEERAGLHYGTSDLLLFGEKVSPRAEEAGFDSLLDYYYFLRYDEGGQAELDRLVAALVVNETYLFRELAQLRAVVDTFLVPWARQRPRLRIWSAACSTGEEPATLAMVLADRGLLDRCEIIASDISAPALARARQGQFGRRALRQIADPALAEKWLAMRDGEALLDPKLLAAIDHRQLNLVDAEAVAALGRFDVILCRNVLIYFSDNTIRGLVNRLTAALQPGGVLLVGVSESLLRFGTSLACEEHAGTFVYRRQHS